MVSIVSATRNHMVVGILTSPRRNIALFVLAGQDYNITGTAGLFKFAQARLAVPFVDRLRDGKTPFSYTPSIYTDNPLTQLAATFTTHTNVYLASIRPPMGSKQALYVEGNTLGISVHGKESKSSGVAFVGKQSTLSGLPWPADSFYRVVNQPSFGPKSDKCFNVSRVVRLIFLS